MPILQRLCIVLASTIVLNGTTAYAESIPELHQRVIVVANLNEPESIELARYYQAKRAIPERNLILLETSREETITWQTFVETLFNPLREQLIDQDWMDAVTSPHLDSESRRRDVPLGHRIAYLVLCHGIPLKISEDAAPGAKQPQKLKVKRASVDAELALLAHPAYARSGAVRNPLFRKLDPLALTLSKVIKVARLDGPDLAAARGLIDRALIAEAEGLRGRAYVDLGGPHTQGDDWLKATADHLEKLGFDLQIEESRELIPMHERFDAPALYFGWWKSSPQGAVSREGLSFPPGALAFHIHSFSARTVRSRTQAWMGPLITRGVTATVGNVYEPYLNLSHRPHLFLEALAAGKTLGDAAFYSLPILSWQAVLIGDPLYRPFKVSLAEQLEEAPQRTSRLDAYAVLRQMRLLQAQGRHEEALEVGQRGFFQSPGLALTYALAQAYLEAGQREKALQTLAFTERLTEIPVEMVPVAKAIADLLAKEQQKAKALALYRTLLSTRGLPEAMERAYLPNGLLLAHTVGDMTLQQAWTQRLAAAPAAND